MNRRLQDGSRWKPGSFHRICSKHFVDRAPTEQNPGPTLDLGYTPFTSFPTLRNPPKTRTLPEIKKTCAIKVEPELHLGGTEESVNKDSESRTETEAISIDHPYYFVCKDCPESEEPCCCSGCERKEKTIARLTARLLDRTRERDQAQAANAQKSESFTKKYLITDKKVSLYIGLPCIQALNDLHTFLLPKARKLRYWKGKKKTVGTKVRNFKKSPKKSGPSRKLTIKEELVLVLMKLRLNLTNEFLADTAGVSAGTVSGILNTWLPFLTQELGPLVFWPEKETVLDVTPPSLKALYPQLRCTLDCSEVFIEKPRHLQTQALTWSDYKHHNTVKFLVGIAPNGCITFLSKCWGGRTTDKHITIQSGFLDLVDPGDVILVDRGFPIKEELMMRHARLEIPPPSAGMEQHSQANVKKTKKVANARIHVERAIGRLKCFQILQGTLPISLVPNINNILVVCAALCNLQPPLVAK